MDAGYVRLSTSPRLHDTTGIDWTTVPAPVVYADPYVTRSNYCVVSGIGTPARDPTLEQAGQQLTEEQEIRFLLTGSAADPEIDEGSSSG
jgi:hypothetical protein